MHLPDTLSNGCRSLEIDVLWLSAHLLEPDSTPIDCSLCGFLILFNRRIQVTFSWGSICLEPDSISGWKFSCWNMFQLIAHVLGPDFLSIDSFLVGAIFVSCWIHVSFIPTVRERFSFNLNETIWIENTFQMFSFWCIVSFHLKVLCLIAVHVLEPGSIWIVEVMSRFNWKFCCGSHTWCWWTVVFSGEDSI